MKEEYSNDPKFTVLVKASGSRVDGVTIESVHEHEADKKTGVKPPSTIIFVTKAGKKWKMEFHEFSFVFPSTQPKAA